MDNEQDFSQQLIVERARTQRDVQFVTKHNISAENTRYRAKKKKMYWKHLLAIGTTSILDSIDVLTTLGIIVAIGPVVGFVIDFIGNAFLFLLIGFTKRKGKMVANKIMRYSVSMGLDFIPVVELSPTRTIVALMHLREDLKELKQEHEQTLAQIQQAAAAQIAYRP